MTDLAGHQSYEGTMGDVQRHHKAVALTSDSDGFHKRSR